MPVEKNNRDKSKLEGILNKFSGRFVERAQDQYLDKTIDKVIDKCFNVFDLFIERCKLGVQAKGLEIEERRLNIKKLQNNSSKKSEKTEKGENIEEKKENNEPDDKILRLPGG